MLKCNPSSLGYFILRNETVFFHRHGLVGIYSPCSFHVLQSSTHNPSHCPPPTTKFPIVSPRSIVYKCLLIVDEGIRVIVYRKECPRLCQVSSHLSKKTAACARLCHPHLHTVKAAQRFLLCLSCLRQWPNLCRFIWWSNFSPAWPFISANLFREARFINLIKSRWSK